MAAFTSIVAGFLTLFALTLALAPHAEAFVYWTDTGDLDDPPDYSIGRANLDGTGADTNFITGIMPASVAVDTAHLYWADRLGTIGRANLDGTGVDHSFIGGLEGLEGVAVDAAHVYWSDFDSGTIGRANLDGSGIEPSFITDANIPNGLAVDAAHVYWTESHGTIGRATLNGTDADPSFIVGASVSGAVAGVAVDAAHVYWADPGFGAIGRANLDGSGIEPTFITPTGVNTGASNPLGVAVDAAHVYWTDFSDNTIRHANLDGSDIEPSFITDATTPFGLTVDALRSFSFGKVKRNKEKGTARLAVKLPGPGEVELAANEGVTPKRKQNETAGKVKLPIRPRGEAKKRLNRKGKAKVKAEVTYTPTGGDPTIVGNTDTKTVNLVKR